MATQNKTMYAILGVLSLTDASGYDIKRFCDKTVSHFWNENFGHIYPVLRQMEARALVEPRQGGDERRKVYGITALGREELARWFKQPVEAQPPRSELLLKLSFGSRMEPGDAVKLLEDTRTRYVARLAEYREMERGFAGDERMRALPHFPYLMAPLRHGILHAEATLRWCEETIIVLREREGV